MTEKEMLEALEYARKESEKGYTVYALCNGQYLEVTKGAGIVEILKDEGFWLVAIFEHGHRVEA